MDGTSGKAVLNGAHSAGMKLLAFVLPLILD